MTAPFRSRALLPVAAVLALGAPGCPQGAWARSNDASSAWTATTHNFGPIAEEGGTVYCEFRLVNRTGEPMAIIHARANCGCTRPEYDTAPIAPGDTAVLRVGFDPAGRPGRFTKRINVDCSGEPTRTSLTITGTVIGSEATLRARYPVECGPVRLRTRTVSYGRVFKGETMGQYIDAVNASADTLHPRILSAPRYINATVQPPVVPPGEQFIVSTVLHSERCPEWGTVADTLTFSPSAGSGLAVGLGTTVNIEEDMRRLTPSQLAKAPVAVVDPVAIDLERIDVDSHSLIKRTFTIANDGLSPLAVRALRSDNPAVRVTLKDSSIKPGKSTRAEVVIDPRLVKGRELLNARLTLVTNDPSRQSLTVRVVGEIVHGGK